MYSATPNNNYIDIYHPMASFEGVIMAKTIPRLADDICALYFNEGGEVMQVADLSSDTGNARIWDLERLNMAIKSQWTVLEIQREAELVRAAQREQDYENGQRNWEQY